MCSINAKLNYGYTILLSSSIEKLFERVFNTGGLNIGINITHIIFHDIIEPWRVIVDEYVYTNKDSGFDSKCKYELVNLVTKVLLDRVFIKRCVYIYKSIVDALNKDPKILKLYNYYEL